MTQFSIIHPATIDPASPNGRLADSYLARTVFEDEVTRIGTGLLGAKVEELLRISGTIRQRFGDATAGGIAVRIPHMNVIATDYFDQFMGHNRLYGLPFDALEDSDIAQAFVDGILPAELMLALYTVVEYHTAPLAVRASRLGPRPFSHGGCISSHCKMIPNNLGTLEERALVLGDAVKLIFASSFFRRYREHLKCVGDAIEKEKTAVIIQDVIGERRGDRFYPTMSGTVHSCNFYPQKGSGLYDGSASLVMGLRKGCISDKDKPWCYALSHPAASVPFNSARHKLDATQTRFFAIDMTASPGRRPTDDCEYIVRGTLADAELDPAFGLVASTYVAENDRFIPGIGNKGARVVDFAPLLALNAHPLNDTFKAIVETVEDVIFDKVAVDFAMTRDDTTNVLELHLLQISPLFMHTMRVGITEERLSDADIVICSTRALGNGSLNNVRDIVYLDPDTFTTAEGSAAAKEVEAINRRLVADDRPYIFIAMGRIGTSDPFRGLQVSWHQISGARVFIETDLPNTPQSFSGGNHFFSDLVSCGSFYFYTPGSGERALDFCRLSEMIPVESGTYVKHVRSPLPLKVMVDGRTQRGIVVEDRWGALQ